MNKRQKRKHIKKWLIKAGYSNDGNLYCVNCDKKLDFDDKWQMKYEACDATCYGRAVGVYYGY